MDRCLDLARSGPVFLRRPEIAGLVVESLFQGVELGHYELGSFVVMANHVHVLLLPLVSPSLLLKSLKGSTAREANRRLGRTGEPFWQRESYDHWVRDEPEWSRISAYIESNPVKAGLVNCAEDYGWSSANERWKTGRSHECERGAHECARHDPSTTSARPQHGPSTTPARPQHDPSTTPARPQHGPSTTPARPQHDPSTAPARPQHDSNRRCILK
ncbi:MAG: transposase [Bryobacteraceae bacterium]|nr:transposase [Bryobacteraceae bacterium]